MSTVNLGNDMLLLMSTDSGVTYKPVAHAKSHTLTINGTVIDYSSKSSGIWAEKKSGRLSWSAQCDGLVSYDTTDCNYESLYTAMVAREAVKIVSSIGEWDAIATGSIYFSGDAYITSLDQTSADEDNVTFSVTFEGAGALSKAVGPTS